MSTWIQSFFFSSPATQAARTKDVILTLRETLLVVGKKDAHLEAQIALETRKAKDALSAANKKGALQALGRRKGWEKELEGLEGRRVLLQTQLNALEAASFNRNVLEAVQKGSKALKDLQGDMDLGKVDQVLDDARVNLERVEDVNEALSAPIGDPLDMSELEAELDALEQEERNSRIESAYAAPTSALPSSTRTSSTKLAERRKEAWREVTSTDEEEEEEEEAAQLRELQAQLA